MYWKGCRWNKKPQVYFCLLCEEALAKTFLSVELTSPWIIFFIPSLVYVWKNTDKGKNFKHICTKSHKSKDLFENYFPTDMLISTSVILWLFVIFTLEAIISRRLSLKTFPSSLILQLVYNGKKQHQNRRKLNYLLLCVCQVTTSKSETCFAPTIFFSYFFPFFYFIIPNSVDEIMYVWV